MQMVEPTDESHRELTVVGIQYGEFTNEEIMSRGTSIVYSGLSRVHALLKVDSLIMPVQIPDAAIVNNKPLFQSETK